MQKKEDLLTLLNLIKRSELEEIGLQGQFHPITIKQLNYYCNPNHTFHRYRQFNIKKKSGKLRQITAPRSHGFIMMLQAVNEILKSMYTPSEYAMGFTEGRSIITNASVHKGQNYVLNLDLKDFFPSIEQPRVWKRLQLNPFNFPVPIANIIAGLCSMRVTQQDRDGKESIAYVLPQGAPTSPIITNMICDTLDRRLSGLARRFGLHYTRYADDITFSSMHYVYSKHGEFWKELLRIISGQGFVINEDKTRLQKRGSRQEVTGVVVSHKLNVTRKYVQDLRNILYIWERHGYTVAFSKFFPKYKAEKGHVKKGTPTLENVIDGKLMYLKMVKGDDDSVYMRLHQQYERLVGNLRDEEVISEKGITIIESMPIPDFEKNHSTVITIEESKSPGHTNLYAYFYIGKERQIASLSESVINLYLTGAFPEKEDKFISLCQNANKNRFWLIHWKIKESEEQNEGVDIDELNNELDTLLNMI